MIYITFFLASTRFVKCDKCARFFVILSENDYSKSSTKENTSPHIQKPTEKFNIQRNPPPPKKVVIMFFYTLSDGVCLIKSDLRISRQTDYWAM